MPLLQSDLDGRNIEQLGNITLIDLTTVGVTPLLNPGQYYRASSNRLFVCAIQMAFNGNAIHGVQQPTLSFGSGAAANDWSPATFYSSVGGSPQIILWTQPTPIYAASTLLFQANVTMASDPFAPSTMTVTVYGAAF